MAFTQQDVDDVIMEGEAMFEKWKEEFERQFYGPRLRETISIGLMMMTPQELSQIPPEQLAQMLELVGGNNGKTR